MQIKITPRTLGGTEFTAQPARLHLGAQNAEGVDWLVFQLPAEWAGCSVTLHIRHSDGTLAAPLVLDAAHSAPVGRSFTGWPAGQWMLAATDGSGYTAYTRPGRYDVYDILPTDGTEEEPSPSVYEQFISQVSGQADAAVQAAQNSAASEASAARQAQAAADAAERAALNGSRAATSASRAESAALRAESFAPVADADLLRAMKLLLLEGKLLCEPSSAIGMGAALCGQLPLRRTDKVCFVISGGSVALEQLHQLEDVAL